ncbi:GAF domain [Trinorchestia longiramus]|nr:GAF domain [Trinorchestia longiramus]
MTQRNQSTDPLSLLDFISSLTERDSTVLQAKINTYLAKAASARLVFLVIASSDEEDLLVHVLGDKSLPARVKVAVTTPCFDRALSTKQPTTLKHLNAQQQEDLFKVLHLLHSPAHLAASRQVSRTLSSGSGSSPVGMPGRPSKDCDQKNANPEVTQDSIGSESPCQKYIKVIPSSPGGDSLTTSGCHKNRCVKRGKSDTESPDPKGMSPLPREALLADNVFLYPSSNDFVRGQLTNLSSAESASSCNSDRYVKPQSFLCVPLPYPDKRNECLDNESEDGQVSVREECSSTAILACFIDKVPHEKARQDAEQKEAKLSADERNRRSVSAGPKNAGVDFRNEEIADFSDEDVTNVHKIFRYAMPLLLTTLAFEAERRQRCHCQTMLGVAQNLFAKLEDVASLLQEIMSEARSLTDAERCSLFLLDQDKKELVAKVFDGQTNDGVLLTESLGNLQERRRRYRRTDGLLGLFANSESEVRLPSTAGIAGHVATTGKLLNIKDAYNHPLFYRVFDEKTGFRTRNMLCFPIQAGEDHHVIGVAELCNKMTGRCFTQFDEQLATSFSVFCGIAITHSLLYNKVSDAHARIKLSNELMMLHMNVSTSLYHYQFLWS